MPEVDIITTITVVTQAGELLPGSIVRLDEDEALSLIERFGGEFVKEPQHEPEEPKRVKPSR